MQFITQSTGLAEELAQALSEALRMHNHVIWFIPGGSNISISVGAIRLVDHELTRKLVILQTDERYVKQRSPDCNWLRLKDAGFEAKQATVFPILVDDNETMSEVAQRYDQTVREQFEAADYIIGQFGVGSDGHTAGIKPESVATRSKQLVAGYQAEDFKRITMTFVALARLNAAYTFAYGADKKHVLDQLKTADMSIETFPAGILKQVPISVLFSG